MKTNRDNSTISKTEAKGTFNPPANWDLLQPLIRVRQETKVSQVRLAGVMGMFQSDVSKKERGRSYIGKGFLEKYERALFQILADRGPKDLAEAKRAAHSHCLVCGKAITQGHHKIRLYCGTICKQAVYRKRKKQAH